MVWVGRKEGRKALQSSVVHSRSRAALLFLIQKWQILGVLVLRSACPYHLKAQTLSTDIIVSTTNKSNSSLVVGLQIPTIGTGEETLSLKHLKILSHLGVWGGPNESVFKWIFIGLLSWGKSIMVVKGEHHLRVVSLLMPKKFVCFASYYGLIMLWHLNSFFKLIKHKFGEAPPVPNL